LFSTENEINRDLRNNRKIVEVKYLSPTKSNHYGSSFEDSVNYSSFDNRNRGSGCNRVAGRDILREVRGWKLEVGCQI